MVKRSYNSPRRQRQAQETRAAIIAAAHALFVERGYEATSIRQVASRAEVGDQTVYRIFGTKAALLRDVMLASYAGDASVDAGRELESLMAAIGRATTPVERLGVIADWSLGSYERGSLELEELVFASARSDPRLQELADSLRERFRRDVESMTRAVFQEAPPPPGMTLTEIADFIYAVWSTPTYRELVSRRGWTVEDYVRWMVRLIERMFLTA